MENLQVDDSAIPSFNDKDMLLTYEEVRQVKKDLVEKMASMVENNYSDRGKLKFFTKSARARVAFDIRKLADKV